MKIKILNYKCFLNPEYININSLITAFVGKNNSGKSSILDIISFIYNEMYLIKKDYYSENTKIRICYQVEKDIIEKVFKRKNKTSDISLDTEYKDDFEFGKTFINQKIELTISPFRNLQLIILPEKLKVKPRIVKEIIKEIFNKHFTKIVCRLNSERRIVSEKNIKTDIMNKTHKQQENPNRNIHILQEDGSFATIIIEEILNNSKYDSSIIENQLLKALNSIVNPELNYISILIQKINKDPAKKAIWEIFLEDNFNGKIALSKSGSGLQTILLTLINLIVIPYLYSYNQINYEYVFIFEELENNLHPSMQRRLINFIYIYAKDKNYKIFISTHSNVILDNLYHNSDSLIYHIINNKTNTKIIQIKKNFEINSILDDLGIHASDLLQVNCIIWVEGPSDRIYINKWISLLSNNELIENLHYQCMFYGGKLLSNLSGDFEYNQNELVKLFTINRNSIIVIDSDIKYKAKSSINKTKNRIKKEIELSGSFCWITFGKEIENYINHKPIQKFLNCSLKRDIKKNEDFLNYLKENTNEKGVNIYKFSKTDFARKIVEYFTKEDLNFNDLTEKINLCIQKINEYNN